MNGAQSDFTSRVGDVPLAWEHCALACARLGDLDLGPPWREPLSPDVQERLQPWGQRTQVVQDFWRLCTELADLEAEPHWPLGATLYEKTEDDAWLDQAWQGVELRHLCSCWQLWR